LYTAFVVVSPIRPVNLLTDILLSFSSSSIFLPVAAISIMIRFMNSSSFLTRQGSFSLRVRRKNGHPEFLPGSRLLCAGIRLRAAQKRAAASYETAANYHAGILSRVFPSVPVVSYGSNFCIYKVRNAFPLLYFFSSSRISPFFVFASISVATSFVIIHNIRENCNIPMGYSGNKTFCRIFRAAAKQTVNTSGDMFTVCFIWDASPVRPSFRRRMPNPGGNESGKGSCAVCLQY